MTSRGIGISLVVTLLLVAAAPPAGAVTVPPDFVVENVVPASTFVTPTALAFLPDGRLLVAEKQGRLWAVTGGIQSAAPLWDGRTEVLSNGDRGLLGIAVDPGFATNRFLYLLYTVDPDSDGVDDDNDAFGRLVRYAISAVDSTALDPATRTILMGPDWPHGPPSGSGSHTVGGLRFGSDGSLLVSVGDGAHYFMADAGGLDPDLFGPAKTNPYEDIGAFRSQYLGSLAGKILRLNPADGNGYPSNPFFDGDVGSNRSRVYAYGVRNSFRFSVAPGTGDSDPAAGDPGVLFVGDVGWNRWEELNVVDQPGRNFGWPCREGFGAQAVYDTLAPSHGGCDSIGTNPWNPATVRDPTAAWHHTNAGLSIPPGLVGNSVTCGVTYTGDRYPVPYRDRLFVADFGRGWIKMFAMDASWALTSVTNFADDMEGPVDLVADPVSGDLYYIAILRNEVRRIRYTGSPANQDPVAVAQATPVVGVAPLSVSFSGESSYDPDLDPITLSWNFGDGEGSPASNTQHSYAMPGLFQAVLTADDGLGGFGRDTITVIVMATAGFPTTGILDDFNRPAGPPGAPWTGNLSGLSVDQNTLLSSGAAAWAVRGDQVHAPNQEVFITSVNAATSAAAVDLLLKVQGTDPQNGHLRVHYDGTQREFWFRSYAPTQGWSTLGDPVSLPLVPGDQFGARAFENGILELLVNGASIKSVDTDGWPYIGLPGRIGLEMIDAIGVRCDDFGGGDVILDPNMPPVAVIDLPQPGLFYADQDTIPLAASAIDDLDPPDSLAYRWDVDLHHNNHVHPSVFSSTLPTTFFIGENHDDGTGVFYTVRLEVTDTGGRFDTTRVDVFPDVDLEAGVPWSDPVAPGTTQPALYGMTIRNGGRMPSPLSRWQLTIDGMNVIAGGDTLVPGLDSVLVSAVAPPWFLPGWHTLTATVDVLDAITEPSETNNSASTPLLIVDGGGTSGGPVPPGPGLLVGQPRPNPGRGPIVLDVETGAPGEIRLTVYDVAGRLIRREAAITAGPGRSVVTWDGRSDDGGRAAGGVYRMAVRSGDLRAVRSVVLLGP